MAEQAKGVQQHTPQPARSYGVHRASLIGTARRGVSGGNRTVADGLLFFIRPAFASLLTEESGTPLLRDAVGETRIASGLQPSALASGYALQKLDAQASEVEKLD